MSKVIFFSLTDGLKMLNIDNGKEIREKLRNVSQFYAELTDFIRVSETLPIKIVIFPLKHKLWLSFYPETVLKSSSELRNKARKKVFEKLIKLKPEFSFSNVGKRK